METLANPPVSTCGPARRGGGNLVPFFCARRVVMKIMYASLLLAGVFCISGNGCNAQQASRGPRRIWTGYISLQPKRPLPCRINGGLTDTPRLKLWHKDRCRTPN